MKKDKVNLNWGTLNLTSYLAKQEIQLCDTGPWRCESTVLHTTLMYLSYFSLKVLYDFTLEGLCFLEPF